MIKWDKMPNYMKNKKVKSYYDKLKKESLVYLSKDSLIFFLVF